MIPYCSKRSISNKARGMKYWLIAFCSTVGLIFKSSKTTPARGNRLQCCNILTARSNMHLLPKFTNRSPKISASPRGAEIPASDLSTAAGAIEKHASQLLSFPNTSQSSIIASLLNRAKVRADDGQIFLAVQGKTESFM